MNEASVGVDELVGNKPTEPSATAETEANPVDVHVGSRIRLRRRQLGMTQVAVGKAVGLPYQQIFKIERGINQVTASYLFQVSIALDVPVGFFFRGLDGGGPEDCEAADGDVLMLPETWVLIRAYYRIPDDAVRDSVRQLMRSMASD